MKNWKTTLMGSIGMVLSFIALYVQNGGNLSDWKLWVLPLLVQVWGYIQKDAGVTGKDK